MDIRKRKKKKKQQSTLMKMCAHMMNGPAQVLGLGLVHQGPHLTNGTILTCAQHRHMWHKCALRLVSA